MKRFTAKTERKSIQIANSNRRAFKYELKISSQKVKVSLMFFYKLRTLKYFFMF